FSDVHFADHDLYWSAPLEQKLQNNPDFIGDS
ncbi:MAG: hypothetical protein RL473_333, partial [Actinomycetota bacterium]